MRVGCVSIITTRATTAMALSSMLFFMIVIAAITPSWQQEQEQQLSFTIDPNWQQKQLIREDPMYELLPLKQVENRLDHKDIEIFIQQAQSKPKYVEGPQIYRDMTQAAASVVNDGDNTGNTHGFQIFVPEGWVADTWTEFDELVTNDEEFAFEDNPILNLKLRGAFLKAEKMTALKEEGRLNHVVMCQQEPKLEIAGTVISDRHTTCDVENTEGVVIVSKYEDMATIPLFEPIVDEGGRNITVDDLIEYHFKVKRTESSTGFERPGHFNYQIRNMIDTQVNLVDKATNEAVGRLPAKFVEYAYSSDDETTTTNNSLSSNTADQEEQQDKAPKLEHILFAVYNDAETREVTGYNVEFKTVKYNALDYTLPGMLMREHPMADELNKIFFADDSFAVVKE